jgi:hypothetical protein
MKCREKTGLTVENVNTDQIGPNTDPEGLEDSSSDAVAQSPRSTQNWAWLSDGSRYDWMDSHTPSFDQEIWNDTFFD